MEYIKNLTKGFILFAHSFLIEKINNQYLIPIYLNREVLVLPFCKQNYPYSYSFVNANDAEKSILKSNLGYKYGFDHPIEIDIDVFDNDKIISKKFIV